MYEMFKEEKFEDIKGIIRGRISIWLIDILCLSATFSNISAISSPEYQERITDLGQPTGELCHLRLFVIYKAGREPTPYWW
jgi:hypothetical protein